MRETFTRFMDRQRRRVDRLGREAEAAAHDAYGKAIRAHRDLKLETPGEVMRHGRQLLQEAEDRAAKAISHGVQKAKTQTEVALRLATQNPGVRSAAVDTARNVGNAVGVLRGGVHAAQGLVDGAVLVSRLADPSDVLRSAPGESAAAQLSRGVVNMGRTGADYIQKGIAKPQTVVADVTDAAKQWRRELDPSATPMAPTFEGELRRNFDIGQNQGELAFDIGSVVLGGPAAKLVKGLPRVSNVGNVDKYLAQGFTRREAAHLAKPYPALNRASHFIPQRTKLPKFLGGGPLPKSYMDGPFNKLAPDGISRGDLYELHYKVDPHFHGTRVRGGRWSGKDLGLERYGPLGQLWHGSPPPLKARVGGLGISAAGAAHRTDEETGW